MEHGSKNRSGGLAQLQIENKRVPCYAVPEMNPICLVFLLNKYFEKLPLFAFKNDVLYCHPKLFKPADDHVQWYENSPVGKNKLGCMIKEMCKEAKISPKTNHSLRATGATSMFQSNVPEKIIQNTTGHRSLESLRRYEKTSVEQNQAVSKVLMSADPDKFENVLQQKSTNSKAMAEVNITNSQNTAFVTKESHMREDIRSVFGNLTNCSIGNITINVNSSNRNKDEPDEEFDIAKFMDI